MQRRIYPLRWRQPLTCLLSLLQKSNASLNLYNQIWKWIDHYYVRSQKMSKPPSHDSVLECMKPYQKYCQLPTTNLQFPVIEHHFLASSFSLLTDDSLTRPENLIFKDAANPTEYHEFKDVYGEVDSGTAYWKFVESLLDPIRAVVIPIIIFGDGTVVDGAMCKPLEPFVFTFGIFWQHIQSNLTGWHILAYIKNNHYSLFTLVHTKEGNWYWKEHQLPDDHPWYVLDSRLEFHAQFWVGVAEDIMDAQNLPVTCYLNYYGWIATPICSKWKCWVFHYRVIFQTMTSYVVSRFLWK